MSYPTETLDNQGPSTADRLLEFLKQHGPASTAEAAQQLALTAEGARQQVQKLLAQGLIAGAQDNPTGVGRPRQRWSLTAAGHQRFPDAHPQLTVQLIAHVRQLFGDEGLDRLIGQREKDLGQLYAQRCNAISLPGRMAQLAELRTAEGYMARIEADGNALLLVEDHCPICAAATTCQGFCRSELQLFQQVAGPASTVVREQHLLAGGARCVYRIMPVPM